MHPAHPRRVPDSAPVRFAALLFGLLLLSGPALPGCGDSGSRSRSDGWTEDDGGTSDAGGQHDADVNRPDGSPPPPPPEECTVPVDPVDVSNPDAVVGTGTPATCTEAAFDTALAGGGIITFDCGPDPFTLTVTSEKQIDQDTVIDGEGLITSLNSHRT